MPDFPYGKSGGGIPLNLQNAGVLTPAFVPDFPYGKSGGGIPLKNAIRPTRGTDRVLELKYYNMYSPPDF